MATAWARLLAPSFAIRFLMCVRTVCGLTPRLTAIPSVESPQASSATTRSSRAESRAAREGSAPGARDGSGGAARDGSAGPPAMDPRRAPANAPRGRPYEG